MIEYFLFPEKGNDLSLEGTRSGMTPEHPEESEDSSCVLLVTKMRTVRQCQEVLKRTLT